MAEIRRYYAWRGPGSELLVKASMDLQIGVVPIVVEDNRHSPNLAIRIPDDSQLTSLGALDDMMRLVGCEPLPDPTVEPASPWARLEALEARVEALEALIS